MRKETAAGWLTAILTCVLLTGCGSQAAGAARTAAAIESQAGSTEEIADHSEEKAEKPRVVLQQEEMGKRQNGRRAKQEQSRNLRRIRRILTRIF